MFVNMNWLNLLGFICMTFFQFAIAWRTDRRPRIYGNKIKLRSLDAGHKRTQRKLVMMHNFFRTKVDPPASNMLAMSWSPQVARDAKRWADACQLLIHDSANGRAVRNYGPCGQNIFVSTHQVPWFFAVKTWWLEKDLFTYNGTFNDLFKVGHYTQLVWHSSHELGCGLAFCSKATPKPFYNYVCNYCPIGNYLESLSRPYERGESCSKCPKDCRASRLCTNTCEFGDLWINCKELESVFHHWLCNTKTSDGRKRARNCRATCKCQGKISYP